VEFNKYFVSAIQNNHPLKVISNHENPIIYLSRTQPFPLITQKCISSKEIVDIIKSLKSENSCRYARITTKNSES
jgi:hypothetical protein